MSENNFDDVFYYDEHRINLLSCEKLNTYVGCALMSKCKNNLKILKYAISLPNKFDVNGIVPNTVMQNTKFKNIPWLFYTIFIGDFASIFILINNGANVNKIFNNSNIIHYAVMYNYYQLIEYFIKKGVNCNETFKTLSSPIHCACTLRNIECVKILLKNADMIIFYQDKNNQSLLLDMIITSAMEDGKLDSEYCSILSLILENKKSFTNSDLLILFKIIKFNSKNFVDDDKIQIIQIIINYFPNILNKSVHKDDMISIAIKNTNLIILQLLFSNSNSNLLKINSLGDSYLHLMIYQLTVNEIKNQSIISAINLIIQICPDILKINDSHERTPIQLLLVKCTNCNYQDIVTLITLFRNNNCDINNVDLNHSRAIEYAVRYQKCEIVEHILKLGANIRDDGLNNDIICHTIKMDRLDVIILLFDNGLVLRTTLIDDKQIFTCVLDAILYNRLNILLFLINIPKIKKITSKKSIKTILLNYCLQNYCIDKEIIKLFANNNFEILCLNINDNTLMSSLEHCINRHISNYVGNENNILNGLKKILTIFSTTHKINNKKIDIFINQIINIFDFHATQIIKLLKIITEKINYNHLNNLYQIILLIKNIELHKCDTCIKMNINFIKIYSKLYEIYLPQINDTIKIINMLATKYVNNNTNMTETILNNNNYNLYDRRLTKLFWPVKLSQHDYIYNHLINNNDNIIKNDILNGSFIVETMTGIRSSIIKLKTNKPSKWFLKYATNICCKEKMDDLHNFSFLLDCKLNNYPCIEFTTSDNTHSGRDVVKLYFYGMLTNSRINSIGVYEYFINEDDELFHRFFRPFDEIHNDIKNLIYNMSNC